MAHHIELVILSVLASCGFAICFQIEKKDLIFAGIGGGLTRIFYLIFMELIPYRIVYVALAAFVAALYAEVMSGSKHTPATYYLYPTIIPLIPGGALYYTMSYAVQGDWAAASHYGSLTMQYALAIAAGISRVWALGSMRTRLRRR